MLCCANMRNMTDETEHTDFVQKLIDAVRQNRCLYDKKHIAYFNRREREKAWRLIGHQLGKSDVDCHKRWKLLREKLAKELKKRDRAIENGEQFKSDWTCFESIMFVEDHIAPRRKCDKVAFELAKNLSKKRNNDSYDFDDFNSSEKRSYCPSDINFLVNLSRNTLNGAEQSEKNVKIEPEDKQQQCKEEKIPEDNPNRLNSPNCSGSSSSPSASLSPIQIPASALDLTNAIDILLRDLRGSKDPSFDFVKNLTNALKIKDLDIFKGLQKYTIPNKANIFNFPYKTMDQISESDSNDEGSVSNDSFPSAAKEMEEENIRQNFVSQVQMENAEIDLKNSQFHNEILEQKPRIFSSDYQKGPDEKDELFGKLVTSMLADITNEEFKDDAKFNIMQLLVNAKRACRGRINS